MLTLALFLAVIATANSAIEQYRLHLELKEHGIASSSGSFLDILVFPGIVSGYVVGTVTASLAGFWSAFVFAMIVAYGAVGMVADFFLRLIRRTGA